MDMCITQSDTFRYAWLRYWSQTTAFYDDGGEGRGWRCSGAIAAWILWTPNNSYSKGNTCHACLTSTAYITRARSLCTSARQIWACVFLVIIMLMGKHHTQSSRGTTTFPAWSVQHNALPCSIPIPDSHSSSLPSDYHLSYYYSSCSISALTHATVTPYIILKVRVSIDT